MATVGLIRGYIWCMYTHAHNPHMQIVARRVRPQVNLQKSEFDKKTYFRLAPAYARSFVTQWTYYPRMIATITNAPRKKYEPFTSPCSFGPIAI